MEVEVSSDVRLYASRFGDLHLVVVWSGRCARARWVHAKTGAVLRSFSVGKS